jgi:hypothetical protein
MINGIYLVNPQVVSNKGTPSDSISVITISFLPKPIILKTYNIKDDDV